MQLRAIDVVYNVRDERVLNAGLQVFNNRFDQVVCKWPRRFEIFACNMKGKREHFAHLNPYWHAVVAVFLFEHNNWLFELAVDKYAFDLGFIDHGRDLCSFFKI